MRKRLLALGAVAAVLGLALLGLARGALAQDAKPMATVSFSGYDALLSDVDMIGKLGGSPNLPKMVETMLKGRTQGKGLAGLDTKRPWGAVVLAGASGPPSGYAFLPVSDLKQLLLVLQATGLPNEDAGNDVHKLTPPAGPPVFVKQQGDWAFVAPNAEQLASLPSDPLALLAGAEKRFDLAVQFHMANVPAEFKQQMLGQLEGGMRRGLNRQGNETDEQYALRKRTGEMMLQQVKTVFEDLATLLVGLAIDEKTQTAYLDLEVTAAAGSKTAEEFALLKSGKSRFAGFALPEAALTALEVRKLSPREITQNLNNLQNARAKIQTELDKQELAEAEASKARQLLDDLMAVVEETIKTGQGDGGGSVLISPSAMTVVVGGQVSDGAKLDKLLRDAAATAVADNPDVAPMIKLDAEKLDGITLHALSLPIPADMPNREKVVQLVGESLEVVVGTDPKSVYLAAGRDAMAKLKAAVEQSKAQADKEVPPVRVCVAVAPIAQFIAAVAEEPQARQVATMVSMTLAQAGSDTHVTMTATPVPDGMRVRLEVEKGILSVLGRTAGMAAAMAPPGM